MRNKNSSWLSWGGRRGLGKRTPGCITVWSFGVLFLDQPITPQICLHHKHLKSTNTASFMSPACQKIGACSLWNEVIQTSRNRPLTNPHFCLKKHAARAKGTHPEALAGFPTPEPCFQWATTSSWKANTWNLLYLLLPAQAAFRNVSACRNGINVLANSKETRQNLGSMPKVQVLVSYMTTPPNFKAAVWGKRDDEPKVYQGKSQVKMGDF